jgi:hypothetical protein
MILGYKKMKRELKLKLTDLKIKSPSDKNQREVWFYPTLVGQYKYIIDEQFLSN